jgi:hypothetical protein
VGTRSPVASLVAFSRADHEHLRVGIYVAGTVLIEAEQPDPLADDAAHRVDGAHVPCHGTVCHRADWSRSSRSPSRARRKSTFSAWRSDTDFETARWADPGW